MAIFPILEGGATKGGRPVLALLADEDAMSLAMYSADFDHENEDPPFVLQLESTDELFAAGVAMITHAHKLTKIEEKRERQSSA